MYVFGVQLSNGNSCNYVRQNGKEPEVENPRWWSLTLKYLYLSLYTIKIATKFQKLQPHFPGPPARQNYSAGTLRRQGKWLIKDSRHDLLPEVLMK